MNIFLWVSIAAIFLAAGVVKGVIGLGLPTLSMALLVLWMPPAEAAALLIVPSLITNIWQIRPWSGARPVWRRIRGMQIGICAGTWAGAWWFGAPAGAWAAIALGVVLVGYAAWGLAGRPLHVPANLERWASPATGVLTGVVTAPTGVFVVPAVAYLQALGLSRDELVQAMGISFTTSTIALAVSLAVQGGYSASVGGGSVAMLVPALAGMALGQWLRLRMPVVVFRQCFFAGLGLLGAYMVLRQLA